MKAESPSAEYTKRVSVKMNTVTRAHEPGKVTLALTVFPSATSTYTPAAQDCAPLRPNVVLADCFDVELPGHSPTWGGCSGTSPGK